MKSLWRMLEKKKKENGAHSIHLPDSLQDIHRDVIVIGAGMAGVLIAYYLKEQGKSVLILEADEPASGQTQGTTAKITSQHGLKYSTLIQGVGKRKARLYAQANEEAIAEFERLIRDKKIDCQFERVPAFLYTLQNKEALEKEAQAAAELGIDAYFTCETELLFPVEGAVCFRNQAQFSPLDFLKEISAELEIVEHAKVTKGKQGSDKERNPECGCNSGCNPLSTFKCTGVLLFASASGEKLYAGPFGVQKTEGNVLRN